MANGRYWLQTLGCPKNQVDSDKLAGKLAGEGFAPATGPEDADLVVVNTCAFIEAARKESVEAVLELAGARRAGARLVVTGCMAERYGDELARALPEVDLVAGFGAALSPPAAAAPAPGAVPLALGPRRVGRSGPRRQPGATEPAGDGPAGAGLAAGSFDLLELPRPATGAPWAYVKVAEGCDRRCGFCAIPSFRGAQRSRSLEAIMAEVATLVGTPGGPGAGEPTGATGGAREIVLVAQDLVSYARDRRGSGRDASPTPGTGSGPGTRSPEAPIVALVRAVSALVPRTRLLYLYPSGLTDELIEAILATGVPYFDLSLQHVSRPLLARMRRWGSGERFLRRIAEIRAADALATMRSSFILGYPGETEEDHDELLDFLRAADLDWAGFFPFSPETGTPAATMGDQVPPELAMERLRECSELQDGITARRRDRLVGERRQVLVDAPGIGRTVHEAPEIDGVVHLPASPAPGTLVDVVVTASLGTDLVASPVGRPGESA